MAMEEKFLAEVKEKEQVQVRVFITQIYQIVVYFCKKCKKNSEEMCECGNFPEPTLDISGAISDGTKTMTFETCLEEVAEALSGRKKTDAKKVTPQEIMKKSHLLEGKVDKNRFFIENVL